MSICESKMLEEIATLHIVNEGYICRRNALNFTQRLLHRHDLHGYVAHL
jgi:hypothetical protein